MSIFAKNNNNNQVSETLRAAGRLKEAGVPLFWLSAYEGEGDVGAWLPEEREEFWDSGARFLPVHRMVESLKYLTKVCACLVSMEIVTGLLLLPHGRFL